MRLIDANLILSIADGEFSEEDMVKIRWLICHIPTAYDIDKVVEELELHSFEFGTDNLPAHYVRLNDVIEILKVGGEK